MKEIFYLMTHSTHFLFTVIWRRTCDKGPEIARERGNPLLRHGLLFPISSTDSLNLIYAPSHREDSLCYTSRGALAGTMFQE